jgi:hypothetical protein
LSSGGLRETDDFILWIVGSNEIDVWNDSVIDSEDWRESSAGRVIWGDRFINFGLSQSNVGSVSIAVARVVVQSEDSAARFPSNFVVSSRSVSVRSGPLDDDQV